MTRLHVRLLLVATMVAVAALTGGCVPGVVGGDRMRVTAYFPDTSGLFVGNDVGILGVPVGTITDIDPQGAQVKVTLEVDEEYDVPVDVGAVVVARSVATDRYVELTPVYDSGPTLGDGDVIPVERTRTPVDFDQVLGALNTFATGIAGSGRSRKAIRRLVDSGARALDGRGALVNDTVTDLADAVGSVSGQREDLSATIRSLDTLVATIAANDRTARRFIDQVAEAVDLLDDERLDFRAALRALDDAVRTVAAFAVDHRDEIVEVVDGGSKVMRTILSRQRDLAEILEVFPLALENLQLTVDGDRIPVRVPPTALLPLGDQIDQLCQSLPLGLCDLISGTDPTDRPSGGRR
ncbi:MCE family protein [Nocardioides sp.]|uniref:MCE family protein n=1 Tax=Nocardioides sp. TaxID=35761 RepID=UPI0023900A85|nr:MCE family protein [Nocardioides sp.]MDE0778615.1 MCE family protein [Nocardioides sp.]